MLKVKWQSLVIVILIAALLTSSCGLLNPSGGSDTIHRASAEIKDSYETPVLDYKEYFPYEFERRERPQLGENAAELEGVEVDWNEAVRFISDELADRILLAEVGTGDGDITIELDESEAIYEPEEFLVHAEKRVGYYVNSKEVELGIVHYRLSMAHPELLIEDFYIPEQKVYLNEDNISFLGEGVTLVSVNGHQFSSSDLLPLGSSTVYAGEEQWGEGQWDGVTFTYSIDREYFFDDEEEHSIWMRGEFVLVRPHINHDYPRGKDKPFHLRLIASEELSIEVGGDFEFSRSRSFPLTGFDIPFVIGEATVALYLRIEADGSISFEYVFEQGVSVEAGIYGEKGKFLPKRDTVKWKHEFDSHLRVEGSVDGQVRLRVGFGATVGLNIMDYDIVRFNIIAGLEAEARYTQDLDWALEREDLTGEDDEEDGSSFSQCFTLKFKAFVVIDGAYSYPRFEWQDVSIDPRSWVPKIEIIERTFEAYNNSWLIYKYKRCGENVGEGSDFAIAQQPLLPGANLLVVRASDGLMVDIDSNTLHGGTTDYYATNISPGTTVHLEAPTYIGEGASRLEFVGWHGVAPSSDPSINFIIEQEDATLLMLAEYIDSPVYKLTVYGPTGLPVTSSTGHGGVTSGGFLDTHPGHYVIENLPEGARVNLSAPDIHNITPFNYNMEFLHWEGIDIRHTTIEEEESVAPTILQEARERLREMFGIERDVQIVSTGGLIGFERSDLGLPELGPFQRIDVVMDSDKVFRAHYTAGEYIHDPDEREPIEPFPEPIGPEEEVLLDYTMRIKSSGASSVLITGGFINPRDGRIASRFEDSTTFSLDNLRGRYLTLTAPEYVDSGESRVRFERWTGTSNVNPHSTIAQPTRNFDFESTSRSINIDMPLQLPLSRADAEKIVTAHYVPSPETPPETVEGPPRYTLNVNSSGDDKAGVDITSNTGHGGKTNYQITNIASQAKIHLEAPEYLGSGAERKRFSSWSGAVSSSNRIITLEMDNNKTVTASYIDAPVPIARPKTYTLEVTSSVDDPSVKIGAYINSKTGHGGTTPYTITGIEEGTKVHLEVGDLINFDGRFIGWSGSISDEKRSINFTMDSDIKLQANYWYDLF